jgi:hypothetical protein
MAGTGFSINDFTSARYFEPLGSRPICFDFRHICLSFDTICFWIAKYRWREQIYSDPRHLLINYSRLFLTSMLNTRHHAISGHIGEHFISVKES